MTIVGITGGIGSGKTTVAKMFESFGVPVYYADVEAKKLNDTSPTIRNGLEALFGAAIYQNDLLDRKKLASLIFSDEKNLQKVNAIIHPEVAKHFATWISHQDSPYVLKEAAILFESGSYNYCDFVILVTAPENIRIARVMERDQVTEEQVKERMNSQWNDEKKKELSDFIIENTDLQNTFSQVERLHQMLNTHK